MQAIQQSGADWWVDSISRFSGGNVGADFRFEALNNNIAEADDIMDYRLSIVSDYEDTNEAEETDEQALSESALMKTEAAGNGSADDSKNAADSTFDESAQAALISDMTANPTQSLAATSITGDRLGILSLLN